MIIRQGNEWTSSRFFLNGQKLLYDGPCVLKDWGAHPQGVIILRRQVEQDDVKGDEWHLYTGEQITD